jgi:flagellar basal body-associated protein FliL
MVTAGTRQTADGHERAVGARRSGRGLTLPGVIALVLAAAGGVYYAAFFSPADHFAGHRRQQAAREAPLPFYLAVKPFAVTLRDGDGDLHLVQLGATLMLTDPSASNIVTTMLPEIGDTVRLTMLAGKPTDIQTAAGIDKLRQKMTRALNRLLRQRLGAERIAAFDGERHRDLIQNVFFAQLFIQ